MYEAVRAYMLAKPGATEDYPFGPEHCCAKVGGKLFALLGAEGEAGRVTLKGDPDRVPHLRATYPAITYAPYMDKRHWNNVALDGSVPDDLVYELVDASYALVVRGLTRAARAQLPQ